MTRALALYDAECGFCTWAMGLLLRWDRGRALRPVAIQSDAGQAALTSLPQERRLASWHLVTPDGTIHSGGAAFAPLGDLLRGGAPLAALARRAPRLTERGYDLVAANRGRLGPLLSRGAVDRAARLVEERR